MVYLRKSTMVLKCNGVKVQKVLKYKSTMVLKCNGTEV